MSEEEIKLIEEMKEICDVWVKMSGRVKWYNQDEIHLIYGIITELQQENSQLKERIEYLERSNNRREETIIDLRNELYGDGSYKERIEKAIEYIEKTYIGSILEVHSGEEEEYTEPLLEILKGDKE